MEQKDCDAQQKNGPAQQKLPAVVPSIPEPSDGHHRERAQYEHVGDRCPERCQIVTVTHVLPVPSERVELVGDREKSRCTHHPVHDLTVAEDHGQKGGSCETHSQGLTPPTEIPPDEQVTPNEKPDQGSDVCELLGEQEARTQKNARHRRQSQQRCDLRQNRRLRI